MSGLYARGLFAAALFLAGMVAEAETTEPPKVQWPEPQPVHLSVRPEAPLFRSATLATSAFSGVIDLVPNTASEMSARQLELLTEGGIYRFIDLDGVSATLLRPDRLQRTYDGSEINQRPYDEILARDVGQVFGLAFDDEDDQALYLTATSVFGLRVVGPDINRDGIPERLQNGQPDARWMAGQWGGFPGSGPGSIYRLNGATGQIDLFANLPNSGAGLGNIAFDPDHDQLFVSDLESGLIHRFSLSGEDLQHFDHGHDARPLADLAAVDQDPAGGIDLSQPGFDTLDPATWHLAPAERRIWGVAVHGGRLFYAVAAGPDIWSVGIDETSGELLADPRWELTVPADHPSFEISDIVVTPEGALVLAQRPPLAVTFDDISLAEPSKAEVLRFVKEAPMDNPDTPSTWVLAPEVIAVGFAGDGHNASGGLTLGPAFTGRGRIDWTDCRGSLWATGENLRLNPDLAVALEKGGTFAVDGLQAVPRVYPAADNSPPWVSYFHDYDGFVPARPRPGAIGDVEANGCHGGSRGSAIAALPNPLPPQTVLPPNTTGNPRFWCANGALQAGLCLCALFPSKCFPQPPEDACAMIEAAVTCDPTLGAYVLDLTLTDKSGGGLDTTKLTDPSGSIGSLPSVAPYPGLVSVDLSGLSAGQTGQINICAYSAADQATGEPYSCCNTTANFKVPGEPCSEGEVE